MTNTLYLFKENRTRLTGRLLFFTENVANDEKKDRKTGTVHY